MPGPAANTRDFSKKRVPVFFTIDDDRFDCYKALDFDQLRRFAGLARGISKLATPVSVEDSVEDQVDAATDAIDRVADVMKIVMKKKSYQSFISRLRPTDEQREDDDFEPIDPVQLMDIVKWLMEIYTSRPTQPSSTSVAGSTTDDGGSPSTAGASHAAGEPSTST